MSTPLRRHSSAAWCQVVSTGVDWWRALAVVGLVQFQMAAIRRGDRHLELIRPQIVERAPIWREIDPLG
jgi:hypothetical protein